MKAINWFLDTLESRWSLIVQILGLAAFFGIPARVAATTETLQRYGPLAWIAAGLLGALTFCAIFLLYEKARRERIKNQWAILLMSRGGANRLAAVFSEVEVRFEDLYDPYYVPLQNKTFRNSRLVGPGMIMTPNVLFDRCTFKNVQVLIVDQDVRVLGAVRLDDARFTDCEIVNLTLVLNPEGYEETLKRSPDFRQLPVLAGKAA